MQLSQRVIFCCRFLQHVVIAPLLVDPLRKAVHSPLAKSQQCGLGRVTRMVTVPLAVKMKPDKMWTTLATAVGEACCPVCGGRFC